MPKRKRRATKPKMTEDIKGKQPKKQEDTDEEDDQEEEPKPIGRSLTSQMMDEIHKRKLDPKTPVPYNKNPTCLADLGYKFHERQLTNIETGAKFQFVDQVHYELLGDLIVTEIQNIMKNECHMVEAFVPQEGAGPKVNIFHSADFFTNKGVLLVLICGSGAVRAGQWARSLCVNNSLNLGSVLPYLEDAHSAGFSTIVLNPNFRTPTLPTQEDHALYVWDNFISKSPAKKIAIVAHSYGGMITMYLLLEREKQLLDRVKGIAYTDSVHHLPRQLSKKAVSFLAKNSKDWVTSKLPLDTKIEKLASNGCEKVSAGHNTHEYTSGVARESVIAYLKHCVK